MKNNDFSALIVEGFYLVVSFYLFVRSIIPPMCTLFFKAYIYSTTTYCFSHVKHWNWVNKCHLHMHVLTGDETSTYEKDVWQQKMCVNAEWNGKENIETTFTFITLMTCIVCWLISIGWFIRFTVVIICPLDV